MRSPSGEIASFDDPNAACFTLPVSLNPKGEVAGFYTDANNVNHGFLRAPDGKVTSFDAPGAGTGSGQGTVLWSNNPAGAITGDYVDANNLAHGYERIPNGKTMEFDVPGASRGTYP